MSATFKVRMFKNMCVEREREKGGEGKKEREKEST